MSSEGKKLLEVLGLIYLGFGIYAAYVGLKSAKENRVRQEKILADLVVLKALLEPAKARLEQSAPQRFESLEADFIEFLIS